MSSTVGEFLREKMSNMGRWVNKELGNEINMDLEQYVAGRTETELAVIASLLSTNSTIIIHKDWSGLSRLGEIPADLQTCFHCIRQREDMHDKFWRYLHLFRDVISNPTGEE